LKKKRQRRVDPLDQAYDHFLATAGTAQAPCPHYSECGGCNMQQYPYETQLTAKLEAFKSLVTKRRLDRYFEKASVEAVASERQLHYRQKMDFVCAFDKSGLRPVSGNRDVIELDNCLLIEEENFKVYKRTLELCREAGFSFYDYMKAEGFLRYISVRRPRSAQQLVSILTISMENSEAIEKIAETLIAEKLADCVQWQINDSRSDTSFGTPYKFWGQETIEETLLGRRFLLQGNTFFQANAEIADFAYSQIRQHALSNDTKHLLDLYSGTCTIGISLSDCVEKVTAVENFAPNRSMAMRNFELNGVDNIEFIDADVADFIKEWDGTPDFAVCNPPRSGVDEKPLRRLMQIKPAAISYLSCNPKTLLEDLQIMTLHYDIESVFVLDMFPQTRHFETLVQLRRKS